MSFLEAFIATEHKTFYISTKIILITKNTIIKVSAYLLLIPNSIIHFILRLYCMIFLENLKVSDFVCDNFMTISKKLVV